MTVFFSVYSIVAMMVYIAFFCLPNISWESKAEIALTLLVVQLVIVLMLLAFLAPTENVYSSASSASTFFLLCWVSNLKFEQTKTAQPVQAKQEKPEPEELDQTITYV